MPRQRFLVIWVGFGLLYTVLAVVGPKGLLDTGVWPFVNQHLLQVRAWAGDDIALLAEPGMGGRVVTVDPGLAVTPYFRDWVIGDPRERVLLANLACGIRDQSSDGSLRPVRYVPADTVEARRQMARMECHVGSPLGPAFVLLPLWLLLGTALQTQWLGAVLGGLGVALIDLLMAWWLETVRGARTVERDERAGLLALAGLGTLWIWLVPQGEVWMFAQTVATTSLTLAMVLAWRRRWLGAGLAFAIAITSRPTTLFALPLLWAILHHRGRPHAANALLRGGSRWRALALAAVFPVLLGGTHLALNQARFGTPFEFGYRFMLTPPELRERLAEHGPFDVAFLPNNARYLLIQPPVLAADEATGEITFPFVISDPQGMGIVFVTPAFLAIFLGLRRQWRVAGLLRACWLSLVLVTAPAMLYFNSGWVQWGGRYLLDGWPMWLMLAALGLQRMHSRLATVLISLSVASNVWAAVLAAAGWWP